MLLKALGSCTIISASSLTRIPHIGLFILYIIYTHSVLIHYKIYKKVHMKGKENVKLSF